MASIDARLRTVKGDPSPLIDPLTVERACREAGHRWRERALDPLSTLRVFAVQVAHGNAPISHLVRLTSGRFCESAYCQARARLPVSVVRAVFEAFTARVRAQPASPSSLWQGHRAVLIDGTNVSTPDTPELRRELGVRGDSPQGCGLPSVHVLAVFDPHAGLLLDLHGAPARTHDLRHAAELHPALETGDVLVGDRGLCSYVHLALLTRAGLHGVFRVPDSRATPFPAPPVRRRRSYNRHERHEPRLVQLLGEDDQVVEILKPSNRPRHVDPALFASLPGKMIVRLVRYRVQSPGVRTRRVTLMTDLVDATAYPAAELAELYRARWCIEVNFRHLKRTLGMDRLKCRSVDGVRRELLIYALIYNAVCVTRSGAAALHKVAPARVSFVDTLRWMLLSGHRALAGPPDIKLWPLRPPRSHPRKLKRSHSTFLVMQQPRSRLIAALQPEEEATN